MRLENCLLIVEKQKQFDTPSPTLNETVGTVNNEKIKFVFSKKDEPFGSSGNHVIFVLVSVLGTNLLSIPVRLHLGTKALVLCYT